MRANPLADLGWKAGAAGEEGWLYHIDEDESALTMKELGRGAVPGKVVWDGGVRQFLSEHYPVPLLRIEPAERFRSSEYCQHDYLFQDQIEAILQRMREEHAVLQHGDERLLSEIIRFEAALLDVRAGR